MPFKSKVAKRLYQREYMRRRRRSHVGSNITNARANKIKPKHNIVPFGPGEGEGIVVDSDGCALGFNECEPEKHKKHKWQEFGEDARIDASYFDDR